MPYHKRIVITGGPGAGKTALLELARKKFGDQLAFIPEAATLIFSGGFWRSDSLPAKMAAQRAIFHIQHEMERLVQEEGKYEVCLCDRGTLDGLAYWPEEEIKFWSDVGSSKKQEFNRYHCVIHLRTPSHENGYNQLNPYRTETSLQAMEIDRLIEVAWDGHPRRHFIESDVDFMTKMIKGMELITSELAQTSYLSPRPGMKTDEG